MKRSTLVVMVVTLLLGFAASASAGVPGRLTEQGRLFMKGTSVPATGTMPMVFSIYAAATGGQTLWTESYNVTLDDGYYSVQLGSRTPFSADVFDGSVRYIGLKVGSDDEMTPRQEVAAVPYALVAGDVNGDIHPLSLSIGTKPVIDGSGKWVGDPTGLQGPKGDPGPAGMTGATGATGPTGAQGAQGAQGNTGPAGPAGVQGPAGVPCVGCVNKASVAAGALTHGHAVSMQVVQSAVTSVPHNSGGEVFATCPGGTTLTGGGCNFQLGTAFGNLRLISSFPGDFGNADPSLRTSRWTCIYENTNPPGSGASLPGIRAYAMCASVASLSFP